jgi:orotate phosphoribosyltransferase
VTPSIAPSTSAKPSRHAELVDFIKTHALKFGDFTLSSGAKSTYYIDGKLVSFDPHGVWLIAEAVLAVIQGIDAQAIGGMDMGATPIVSAVALRSHEIGRPLKSFTVRKETKGHGAKKRIEGPLPAKCKVVIIDDVVTTGDSILKSIDAVEEAGCQVQLAISVVDRDAGAIEALGRRGIPYRPLVHLAELGVNKSPA